MMVIVLHKYLRLTGLTLEVKTSKVSAFLNILKGFSLY